MPSSPIFSRIRAANNTSSQQVDLLPLLEDTLTLLEHRLVGGEHGTFASNGVIHFSEAMALADGDKIKQVFWNFCENAVRAMGAGGVLRRFRGADRAMTGKSALPTPARA